MKTIGLLVCLLALAGCGTVTTLSKSDQEISSNLKRQKTSCETMPRVYSGVAYNVCKMNSNGSSIYIAWQLGFHLFDSVLSAATDTVALPFTIYDQSKNGSLEIGEDRRCI